MSPAALGWDDHRFCCLPSSCPCPFQGVWLPAFLPACRWSGQLLAFADATGIRDAGLRMTADAAEEDYSLRGSGYAGMEEVQCMRGCSGRAEPCTVEACCQRQRNPAACLSLPSPPLCPRAWSCRSADPPLCLALLASLCRWWSSLGSVAACCWTLLCGEQQARQRPLLLLPAQDQWRPLCLSLCLCWACCTALRAFS